MNPVSVFSTFAADTFWSIQLLLCYICSNVPLHCSSLVCRAGFRWSFACSRGMTWLEAEDIWPQGALQGRQGKNSNNITAVSSSPFLEALEQKGLEVLYLCDPLD